MNNSVNNDHGFIGTGTPYFHPDDGSPAFFFGNPVSCKITSSSDKKIRKSRRKNDAGGSLDSLNTPQPAEVSIITDTFQPKTWAMAMMGKAAKVTRAVQTVTDEPATAVLDGYHQLANGDIDPATIVVSKAATALDASDFTLNEKMGLLQITNETAAAEGDALTVSYTTKLTTRTVIDGAKVSSFTGKIVIDGTNDVTKKDATLTIHKVSLAVNGDFDWFSEDFNQIEMTGTASIGKNGEAPYVVELDETV